MDWFAVVYCYVMYVLYRCVCVKYVVSNYSFFMYAVVYMCTYSFYLVCCHGFLFPSCRCSSRLPCSPHSFQFTFLPFFLSIFVCVLTFLLCFCLLGCRWLLSSYCVVSSYRSLFVVICLVACFFNACLFPFHLVFVSFLFGL